MKGRHLILIPIRTLALSVLATALFACSPGSAPKATNTLPNTEPQQTGGLNEQGTAYTSSDPFTSEILEQYKNLIPPTPDNLALAKHHEVEIRFLNAQNKQVESLADATRLWVIIFIRDDNGKLLDRLQYTLNITELRGEVVPLKPVSLIPSRYQATIQCKDSLCASLVVHLTELTTPMAPGQPGQPKPPVRPPHPTPPAKRPPVTPSPSPGRPEPSPQEPSPTPPATGTPIEAATVINAVDAEITFKILAADPAVVTPPLLAQQPALEYIVQNYLSEDGTPILMQAVSRVIVHGRSRTLIRIPVGAESLCLDIDLLETNNEPTDVRLTCNTTVFKNAHLEGNSREGWLVVQVGHISGVQLILSINLNPRASEEQRQQMQPLPVLPIDPSELEKQVNSRAYLKVDLSKPRTREMESLLQGEQLGAEQDALIKTRLNYWMMPENHRVLEAFFRSAIPLNSKTQGWFKQFDLPISMILVTIQESRGFWTRNAVEVGPARRVSGKFDCAVGPLQLMYYTALDTAERLKLGSSEYKLVKPLATKAGRCVGGDHFVRGQDDRADFGKASRYSAEYFSFLSRLFREVHAKGDTRLDPRIVIASYNRGQGGMASSVFQAVATDTQNKDLKTTDRVRLAFKKADGSYERLFALAEVYPDFWRLRKLNTFPKETDKYVLDWMIFRRINQAPADYNLVTQPTPVPGT